MNRERQYEQLAGEMFLRASEEAANVQLKATQWQILGARYLEISRQSGGADPVQSELLKGV